jgi:hypothetical protein
MATTGGRSHSSALGRGPSTGHRLAVQLPVPLLAIAAGSRRAAAIPTLAAGRSGPCRVMERDHLQQRLRADPRRPFRASPSPTLCNPGAGSPRLQGRARGRPGDRGGQRWRCRVGATAALSPRRSGAAPAADVVCLRDRPHCCRLPGRHCGSGSPTDRRHGPCDRRIRWVLVGFPAAVGLAILGVAALFQPARRRIQQGRGSRRTGLWGGFHSAVLSASTVRSRADSTGPTRDRPFRSSARSTIPAVQTVPFDGGHLIVEHVDLVIRRCAPDATGLWRCRALGCDRWALGSATSAGQPSLDCPSGDRRPEIG